MDMDALWTRPTGGRRSWWEWIPSEAKAELVELADKIILRGQEPSWPEVVKEFKKEFPGYAPRQVQTVREAVRKLVEARS